MRCLHINIIYTFFQKKLNILGVLCYFFVFLYKMRDVTDYLQIGPILWEYFSE